MTPALAERRRRGDRRASTWRWAASRDRAGRRSRAPLDAFVRPGGGGGGLRGHRAHLPRPRAARVAEQGAAGLPARRVGRGALSQGARGAARCGALPRAGRDARGATHSDHIGVFRQRQAGPQLRRAQDAGGPRHGRPARRAGAAQRSVRAGGAAIHAVAGRAAAPRARRAARRPDPGAAAQGAALQPVGSPARPRLVHRHGLLQPRADRHQDARHGAREGLREDA